MLGLLYRDGPEQARCSGFFRMSQSLGYVAGFALVPSAAPIVQLGLVAASLGAATLAFLELPPRLREP